MSAGRENLENLARMFACQTFSDLVKEELFVTPLAGAAGLRHYIFRVDGPSDVLPLTIRVNAILDDEERIKSEREFFALKWLDGRHAPKAFEFDVTGQLFQGPAMCLEFVDGRMLKENDLDGPAVRACGRILSELHSVELEPEIRDFLRPEKYQTCAGYLEWRMRENTNVVDELGRDHGVQALVPEYIRAVREESPNPQSVTRIPAFRVNEAPVLVHGDVNVNNFVWESESQARLIDWEDVRLGDAAEDIAYFFIENLVGADLQTEFWDEYGQHTSLEPEALRHRAEAWRGPTILASGLWWLDRYCNPVADDATPREFYREGAEDRLRWFAA